ncbi:uncharacterized mitochondrial protein AtMg00810-like [Benincasa hispida]|uniref:uncharacterized mitochondrial protein AtMg00810-like n=1 Tax=Benincasa hispida TaxID=102211 RepID=UPI001900CE7D|nr:uncharacterized mitochondrial protein AtMg00810-like [Benincasa hispida]
MDIMRMSVTHLKQSMKCQEQAPRARNSKIDKYFQEKKYMKCPYEHALYIKMQGESILIICLYVDDLVFTRNNPSMFDEFKREMVKVFEMTDIGLMSYYLGIKVKQGEDGIFISQDGYAKEVLKKFNMNDANLVGTPMECGVKITKQDGGEKVNSTYFKSLIGSLRYLTCTRPDILYSVRIVFDLWRNRQ